MIRQKKKKRKLFGCPPPPTLIFKNWKKSFYCTKVYSAPNFQNSKKSWPFFFWEFWSFKNIFLSCSFQLVYILILVLNLYIKIFLGKVDLFAPSLGDIEAIILCSFDFDLKKNLLKKKICLPAPSQKKKSCGGQPNNYFFRPKHKNWWNTFGCWKWIFATRYHHTVKWSDKILADIS